MFSTRTKVTERPRRSIRSVGCCYSDYLCRRITRSDLFTFLFGNTVAHRLRQYLSFVWVYNLFQAFLDSKQKNSLRFSFGLPVSLRYTCASLLALHFNSRNISIERQYSWESINGWLFSFNCCFLVIWYMDSGYLKRSDCSPSKRACYAVSFTSDGVISFHCRLARLSLPHLFPSYQKTFQCIYGIY